MPGDFPRYDVVDGGVLEQGDILFSCPVPVLTPTFPLPDQPTADINIFDMVVMTQSCDLENDKVRDIIVCPHWSLKDAGEMDKALTKKNTWIAINKGQLYRYALLAGWQISEPHMEIRIVDFGRVFCLPREYLSALAANLRKAPPPPPAL